MKSPNQIAIEAPFEPSSKQEVAAFEKWAFDERYDMTTHPLHWLFLNERTSAARDGWRAALTFVRDTLAAITPPAQGSIDAHSLPPLQLTDAEIEALFEAALGSWNGDQWVIEDADLHPFVRGILADRAARQSAAPTVQDADPSQGMWELRNIISNTIYGYGARVEDHVGVVDAIAKVVAERAALAQRAAVAEVATCLTCAGEGWVRDVHDMEQGLIRCQKCPRPTASTPPAPVQSAAPGDAVDEMYGLWHAADQQWMQDNEGRPVQWGFEKATTMAASFPQFVLRKLTLYAEPATAAPVQAIDTSAQRVENQPGNGHSSPAPSELVPQGVPEGEPLVTLILGGIDGDEYDSWDLEVISNKAIDALQSKLVKGSDPVYVNLYASAPTATSGGEAVAYEIEYDEGPPGGPVLVRKSLEYRKPKLEEFANGRHIATRPLSYAPPSLPATDAASVADDELTAILAQYPPESWAVRNRAFEEAAALCAQLVEKHGIHSNFICASAIRALISKET